MRKKWIYWKLNWAIRQVINLPYCFTQVILAGTFARALGNNNN